MTTVDFEQLFDTVPVLGIFRGQTPERTLELCEAAWDAGVRAVEIPVQNDSAFEALELAAGAAAQRGAIVGAGTVRSEPQLLRAVEAGARFTVAPGLDLDVVRRSQELGVPHLPGVATSTDVHTALNAGLRWLKAFPASVLGADWVTAQHGPFPEARFVATGGISTDNAQRFIDAGCRAVAIGSAFADPAALAKLRAAGLLG